MPAGLDEAGNNPFFVGHHEGTPMGVTNFKGVPNKNPLEPVAWVLKRHFPGITPYLKDWLWKELERSGVLEKAGEEGFEDLLEGFLTDFKEKLVRIEQRALKSEGGQDGRK